MRAIEGRAEAALSGVEAGLEEVAARSIRRGRGLVAAAAQRWAGSADGGARGLD